MLILFEPLETGNHVASFQLLNRWLAIRMCEWVYGGDHMLQVKRGTVKFFRADKGWGYIIPNEGGPEVWFHVEYFAGVEEEYDGELRFKFDQDSTLSDYHQPKKGEAIVYDECDAGKGPMALYWLYPETLAKAEKMLAMRPDDPGNFFVRVMRFGVPEMLTRRAFVFWKGTYMGLRDKLDADFPEMFDNDFSVEKLEIDGKWKRMWHPSEWHPKYKRTTVAR